MHVLAATSQGAKRIVVTGHISSDGFLVCLGRMVRATKTCENLRRVQIGFNRGGIGRVEDSVLQDDLAELPGHLHLRDGSYHRPDATGLTWAMLVIDVDHLLAAPEEARGHVFPHIGVNSTIHDVAWVRHADVVSDRLAPIVQLDTHDKRLVFNKVRRSTKPVGVDHLDCGLEWAITLTDPLNRSKHFTINGVLLNSQACHAGQSVTATRVNPTIIRLRKRCKAFFNFLSKFVFPHQILFPEQPAAVWASVHHKVGANNTVLPKRDAALQVGIIASQVTGTSISNLFGWTNVLVRAADSRRVGSKFLRDAGRAFIGVTSDHLRLPRARKRPELVRRGAIALDYPEQIFIIVHHIQTLIGPLPTEFAFIPSSDLR